MDHVKKVLEKFKDMADFFERESQSKAYTVEDKIAINEALVSYKNAAYTLEIAIKKDLEIEENFDFGELNPDILKVLPELLKPQAGFVDEDIQ